MIQATRLTARESMPRISADSLFWDTARILFPIILLICLIGTYSINMSSFELLVLLGSGVLGYFFRKLNYDLAPFILALIIGPTLEETFRQSLMRSGGSFSIFWERPIALTFMGVSFLLLIWNIYRSVWTGEKVAQADGS